MNNKEGMFGKIIQKGKALTGAIALSTVIAGADKVEAQQVKPLISAAEQSRHETAQKSEALNLFKVAMEAEAREGLTNEFEIEHSKKRVAEIKLQLFALRLKQGFPEGEKQGDSGIVILNTKGTVSGLDVMKALPVLKRYFDDFLDKNFGNGNGIVTAEERTKFKESLSKFPGLEYLYKKIETVR